jgi:pyruvate/2-oxoacid:ferredoxin oxidoreductase alpha subunit
LRKQLMKGNEALMKSAMLSGCRAFYGYPITPASEIAEVAALYMPKTGGVFLQAESEVAAINMLYGASSAGVRCMTASCGPGISLMQEGMSYLAGAELPCVIADMTRSGPGLGNIAAEQSDYNQVVKGGGHGNYRTIVLAPHSVQEMAGLTSLAFELADRYRNPVVVLADGFIGQMVHGRGRHRPRGVWHRGPHSQSSDGRGTCRGHPGRRASAHHLIPIPVSNFRNLAKCAQVFVVVEMSIGQMVDDVRLALNGARPVEFLGRGGGNVPSHQEVLTLVSELACKVGSGNSRSKERIANV